MSPGGNEDTDLDTEQWGQKVGGGDKDTRFDHHIHTPILPACAEK